MFRFIQHIRPQKILLDKFQYSIKCGPKLPALTKILARALSGSTAKNTKDFAGENVVITEGGEGLGRALAVRLGRLQATVAIWDSDQKALDETSKLVKSAGGRVFTYLCDLSHKDDIYRIAEKTKRDIGQITMLINNADDVCHNRLLDTPDNEIERAFKINVLSHFWTAKAFLPSMIQANRGHIVTISSMASQMGISKLTDYCSTKAASMAFSMALRTELEHEGSNGVETTLICPYFIQSRNKEKEIPLRMISALNPDDVAERTIEALKSTERIIFIPRWFRFALIPKWLMPFSVSSFIKKILINHTPSEIEAPKPLKTIKYMRPAIPKERSFDKHTILPFGTVPKSIGDQPRIISVKDTKGDKT